MSRGAPYLVATLIALAVVAMLLLLVTVEARVARRRRERAASAVRSRWRALLVEVASGEDQGGQAWQVLSQVSPEEWDRLRPAVLAMLGKVRGRPSRDVAGLLHAHGDVASARLALGSSRAGRRAHAARLLGLARDESSLDALRALLADASADVRVVAARGLGLIGDPQAAPDVLAAAGARGAVAGHESGLPAWVAAETLLLLGPKAHAAVAQAIGSPDASVRSVAAQVARHVAYPGAVPLARTCVHFETEPGTRETLLGLLGTLGEEQDVPVLAAYTHPLAPPRLRRAATAALGELASDSSRRILIALLDDDDRSIAVAAGDALAVAGPAGLELLAAARRGRGRPRRVAAAALHLARLREEPSRGVA